MNTDPFNAPSSLPEAVVFDLGKVLVDFDYERVAARIANRGGPALTAAVRIETTPLLVAYETGRMSTDEFYEAVRERTGYTGTSEEFATDFGDIFSPIDEMISFQAALRERGIPTFIFSNTNELAIRHIRRQFPFFAGFDHYVLSYEVGAMKPDEAIYAEVERVTGRRGEQILYLDDRPENIATGSARGWQTIEHRSAPETLANDVVRALLNGG